MGLIREPRNVDIVFADKELTEEDKKRISEYIRKQKSLPKKRSVRTSSGKHIKHLAS